jgi:predicted  nucleic acid-binding Zn-ribbon protein
MSTQPEAMRLLQHMKDEWPEDWDQSAIKAELLRLHNEVTDLKQTLAAPDLQAELDATNRQVEILSDALAKSRRQRQWAGLTDEEKRQIFEREDYQGWLDYINAIEAKLKERNT